MRCLGLPELDFLVRFPIDPMCMIVCYGLARLHRRIRCLLFSPEMSLQGHGVISMASPALRCQWTFYLFQYVIWSEDYEGYNIWMVSGTTVTNQKTHFLPQSPIWGHIIT